MKKDLLNEIIIRLANNTYTFKFEANNVLINGKDTNGDKAYYVLTRGQGDTVDVLLNGNEIVNILYDVDQAILFLDFINAYKE